jgi:hypothetical protein
MPWLRKNADLAAQLYGITLELCGAKLELQRKIPTHDIALALS